MKKKNISYLVHELLDARPQHVLRAVVDGREGLVDAGDGGAPDVGDEVREVLGDLELDLARRLHWPFPLLWCWVPMYRDRYT